MGRRELGARDLSVSTVLLNTESSVGQSKRDKDRDGTLLGFVIQDTSNVFILGYRYSEKRQQILNAGPWRDAVVATLPLADLASLPLIQRRGKGTPDRLGS